MTDDERDMLLFELRTELKNLRDDVDDIRHVLLEGNGKPALTEQVLVNKIKIDRLEEERADRKLPRAVWVAILLSSLLSLAGVVAAAV